MQRKLFIRTATAVGLFTLSAVASAHPFPSDGIAEEAVQGMFTEASFPGSGLGDAPFLADAPEVIPEVIPAEEPLDEQETVMDLSEQDRYLLAKIAMAEAEGEDTEGKALVMLVVLNRVNDDEFPESIEEVIYQPGQFSPISDGRFDTVEPSEDCWKALDLITTDKWDESLGATYFESRSSSTWHRDHLEFLFQHGNHYFYKEWEE